MISYNFVQYVVRKPKGLHSFFLEENLRIGVVSVMDSEELVKMAKFLLDRKIL